MKTLSLYIHIPFCSSRCHYCAFAVTTKHGEHEQRTYIKKLKKELQFWTPRTTDYGLRTTYLGGGTPSLLEPDLLEELFATIKASFTMEATQEITLEVNPEHITPGKAKVWKQLGITRISIGAQSFNNHELRLIGRKHHANKTKEAVQIARDAGFTNISLDLIIGLPDQTQESFEQTVQELLALDPTHLSSYFLIRKKGSAFEKHLPAPLPEEDTLIEMYQYLDSACKKQGLITYELSNWSKPDHECRHNQNTWHYLPYIGTGMGAHSFFEGRRFENPALMEPYLAHDFSTYEQAPTLTPEEEFDERVTLALRTREGMDLSLLEALYPKKYAHLLQAIPELEEQELINHEKKRITTTKKGRLFVDHITSHLLLP